LSSNTLPRLAVTLGDVNGVSPEILVRALCDPAVQQAARLLVFGDPAVLAATAERLALRLPECEVRDAGVSPLTAQPGALSAAAGDAAHRWICAAVKAIQHGEAQGLVTCPISKEAVLLAGHADLGHPELLARLTNAQDWRMCLFTREKLVVHVSAHVPLRQAVETMSTKRISDSIEMARAALLRLGQSQPRIAVAGLNPHAGEHGAIGTEDDAIILPAVSAARSLGWDCHGPVSPDAVFRQLWEGDFDAVVAMYHDQGHIAMKMVAMDEGVSLTLGLPFPRTSPDHGTAFDIAGKGIARADSLCAALRLAARLAS